MGQWFELGTSMLEVSSLKPLASGIKRFALCVELIAPGLPSVGYLSYVVCELLHRSGFYPVLTQKGSGCGFPLLLKKKSKKIMKACNLQFASLFISASRHGVC